MARNIIKHGDTWFIDDENYDYSKEIQKAVDAGDYRTAAYLEKSRNAKIDRFVMPYEKTYAYQGYLTSDKKEAPSVPSFENGSYGDKASRVLGKAQAMNFHYNANNDPLYKQIKKNYENTASDVIENTMGSYAGMTGGVPSSYAASAAAQAGAQHMQKADDMIPELYELAYGKFADQKADLYKQYGIYQGLEDQEYQRGRDALSDEWKQKQWDYGVEQDAAANKLAETKAENEKAVALAEIEAKVLKEGNEMQKQYFEIAKDLVEMGTPPGDDIMAMAGLDMTGRQFYDNYVSEINRQLAEKAKYSSKGSQKDDTPELKNPTESMYNAIDKLFEEGDGIDGIEKLKERYDWDKYDEAVFDDYVKQYYGNEDGVSEYFYEPSFAEKYADKINTAFKKRNGDKYSALKANGDGTYSLSDAESAYIIKAIFEDDSLTQDEAESLLYDYFGITEKQVQDVLNDRHYR